MKSWFWKLINGGRGHRIRRTCSMLSAVALLCAACGEDGDEAASDAAASVEDAAAQGEVDSGNGGAGGQGGAGGEGAAGGQGDAGEVEADAGAADAGALDPDSAPTPDAGMPDAAAQACRDDGLINPMTEDGLRLVGDFKAAPGTGKGAVLLHMIPPGNDRSNYPQAFIDALVERGYTVINLDRRGAGGSEGVAREAYEGPNGRLDALAGRDALLASGCGVDPAEIVFVGASNGTTSVLDYAVTADVPPAALVFLTGGPYTENQTAIANQREALDDRPILFVYSTAERAWSAQFTPEAAEPWSFQEYERGAHGTRMFNAVPESIEAVADWIEATRP